MLSPRKLTAVLELMNASISFTGPQRLFLFGVIISEGVISQKPNLENVFAENALVSIQNKLHVRRFAIVDFRK